METSEPLDLIQINPDASHFIQIALKAKQAKRQFILNVNPYHCTIMWLKDNIFLVVYYQLNEILYQYALVVGDRFFVTPRPYTKLFDDVFSIDNKLYKKIVWEKYRKEVIL